MNAVDVVQPDRLPHSSPGQKRWRAAELVLVFLALPAAIAFWPIKVPLIPVLWLLALVGAMWLWRDPGFDRRRLWNAGAIRRADLALVLIRFAVLAALLAGLLYACLDRELLGLRFPPQMFMFPRVKPWIWLAVMVAYPLVSVLPQNIVWRVFFSGDIAPCLATAVGWWSRRR